MRLAVFSDLHLECRMTEGRFFAPHLEGNVDAALIAGDTAPGVDGIAWASRAFPSDLPVIMIPGNHEYFGADIETLPAKLQQAAEATPNVTMLDRGETWLRKDGKALRILGATLWTDFALDGADLVPLRKAQAHEGMPCYRAIRRGERPLRPDDTAAFHARDLAYLTSRLGEDVTIPTVVMTHHAPSCGSIHPKYAESAINAAFASNLSRLILSWGPRIWVHGHVHSLWDYQLGETRIIANPLGYPGEIYRDESDYKPLYIEL